MPRINWLRFGPKKTGLKVGKYETSNRTGAVSCWQIDVIQWFIYWVTCYAICIRLKSVKQGPLGSAEYIVFATLIVIKYIQLLWYYLLIQIQGTIWKLQCRSYRRYKLVTDKIWKVVKNSQKMLILEIFILQNTFSHLVKKTKQKYKISGTKSTFFAHRTKVQFINNVFCSDFCLEYEFDVLHLKIER